jgi:uncharacterized membrane protein
MELTPVIAIHLAAALSAVVLGPFALWARLGRIVRPRWHRALGYAWTTCVVAAAVSAMFIRDERLPNVAGFTPIHLLVPVTLLALYKAFARWPGPTSSPTGGACNVCTSLPADWFVDLAASTLPGTAGLGRLAGMALMVVTALDHRAEYRANGRRAGHGDRTPQAHPHGTFPDIGPSSPSSRRVTRYR